MNSFWICVFLYYIYTYNIYTYTYVCMYVLAILPLIARYKVYHTVCTMVFKTGPNRAGPGIPSHTDSKPGWFHLMNRIIGDWWLAETAREL